MIPESDVLGEGRFARLARRLSSFVRDLLTVNLYLKLLAFALAVLLRVIVAQDQEADDLFEVYVDVRIPADRILVKPPVDRVVARLGGPKSRLELLHSQRLEMTIDLENTKLGEVRVPIPDGFIENLPKGIRVKSFSPSELTFQIEEKARATLPVKVETRGEPAKGYWIKRVKATPPTVDVAGPAGELDKLEQISTDVVDVRGIRRTREKLVELKSPSPLITFEKGQDRVKVSIEVEAGIEQREWTSIPVHVPPSFVGAEVKPSTARVVLVGPMDVLESVEARDIAVRIVPTGAGEVGPSGIYRVENSGADTALVPYRLSLTYPNPDVLSLQALEPSSFTLIVPEPAGRGTENGKDEGNRREMWRGSTKAPLHPATPSPRRDNGL